MGQRELLLTIGAIVVFSLTSLSINRLSLRNTEAIYGQQAEFYAVSVAQRFIEEAKVKAFDENTIIGTVTDPSGFSTLGPDTESYPNFDDVDDYDGYSTTDPSIIGTIVDSVSISVVYVQDDLADSGSKTYYKKMTVTAYSDYLNNPVRADYVFAYQKN
ncbi:MAG: hypothetical protein ACE5NG_08015 [bacterium]